jgi:hypothetical protein
MVEDNNEQRQNGKRKTPENDRESYRSCMVDRRAIYV